MNNRKLEINIVFSGSDIISCLNSNEIIIFKEILKHDLITDTIFESFNEKYINFDIKRIFRLFFEQKPNANKLIKIKL